MMYDFHSDDVAVLKFSGEMQKKMQHSRVTKGRHGWDDPNICSIEDLKTMLNEHIGKGDMIDVANIAMMIWHREQAA